MTSNVYVQEPLEALLPVVLERREEDPRVLRSDPVSWLRRLKTMTALYPRSTALLATLRCSLREGA